jgi:hypothetical protein
MYPSIMVARDGTLSTAFQHMETLSEFPFKIYYTMENYQPNKYRKERIYSKREKLAFRCMRAFEWDSLAGQIYLCEDLYLKELTAIQKIMTCSGHCVHLQLLSSCHSSKLRITVRNKVTKISAGA